MNKLEKTIYDCLMDDMPNVEAVRLTKTIASKIGTICSGNIIEEIMEVEWYYITPEGAKRRKGGRVDRDTFVYLEDVIEVINQNVVYKDPLP
jgi:hypothetical protein